MQPGVLALAVGSRETVVLFPVIALFWELLFKTGRRPWIWLGAQAVLVAGYLAAQALVVGPASLTSRAPLPWLNAVAVIVSSHLHSMVWPGWGVRFYPFEEFSAFSPRVLLAYGVLTAGLAALAWGLKRNRWIAFWLLWFGVWLSIHFNVGRFGDFLMAEKDEYILALSFAVLFVSAARLAGRYALVLCAVIAVAHGGLGAWRVTHWRDPVTFFPFGDREHATACDLHYNLGLAHVDIRDLPSAEAAFRKTVELAPGHRMAWNNLGNVRYEQANFAGAIQAWERALEQGNMLAARNLSVAYSRIGDKDAAARYYFRYLQPKARQAAPSSRAGTGN